MVRDQEATAHQQENSTTPTLKVHAQQKHIQNQTVDNLADDDDGRRDLNDGGETKELLTNQSDHGRAAGRQIGWLLAKQETELGAAISHAFDLEITSVERG